MAAALGLTVGAVAGCSSATPARPSAAAERYLVIATPANRVLDKSFDSLEDDSEDLRASAALLQTIATTEHRFDRDLRGLTLPASTRRIAAELVRVNETRADLTAEAASARTIAALTRWEVDLDAMNVSVESQVRALRKDLGLPPPETE